MKTPWLPCPDTTQLPREERKVGRFTLLAWPDGHWAIDFAKHRVRQCANGQELDSLEAAKDTCDAVLRNMLAEALSDFGEQP